MIDTDILIDIDRERKNFPNLPCFISVVTFYEFIRGKVDPPRAKYFLEKLCIMIGLDNDVLKKASNLWRVLRKEGSLIDDRDLLIGATAIAKGLPLWTENEKHFKRLEVHGLKLWK